MAQSAGNPIRDAMDLCKTIMRNGHDAYVIGPALQERMLEAGMGGEVEIATDMGRGDLVKLFPELAEAEAPGLLGKLGLEECVVRVYLAEDADAGHLEAGVSKVTPTLLGRFEQNGTPLPLNTTYHVPASGPGEGFEDFSDGLLRFAGIPDETLKRDYLLAVRALRLAANHDLNVEPNSWAAIVRCANRVNDYVPAISILDEMRMVEPANLHRFVRLMFDSMILHGLIPELAALSRLTQLRDENGQDETVLEHTLAVMRHYPEELPHDWFGTLACLFHDIGKLYTAEYTCGHWEFFQHHRVGAKATRRIMSRLGFCPSDTDMVCHLVRHHMRLNFMLTDKGIRRFRALDDYPRLIEMARADVKARGGDYTHFNHNMKYLQRADVAEELVEPLLNGRQIMSYTGLKPGPAVGIIRDALLEAQIAGEVDNETQAEAFVRGYARQEGLA